MNASVAAVEAILAQAARPHGPGAALIAVQEGNIVYRGALGLADVERGTPLTADSVFRIGSITKQFVAVAILLLQERGQLALGDTIGRFIPDWPAAGRDITLLQLLQHTAGLANYTTLPQFRELSCLDAAPQVTMALYRDAELTFAPGTRFAYSNSGYHLLGIIVETISGLSLAHALRQWIFEPLQLRHTTLEQPGQMIPQRAAGHTERDGQCVHADPVSMSHPYAAGGMVSTLDDLARWNSALLQGKVLQQSSLELAFTRGLLADGSPIPYGLGWQLGEVQGLPSCEHAGAISGFLSWAITIPSAGLYVTLLCNRDSGINCEWIMLQVCAQLLGRPWASAPPLDVEPERLQPYAGNYFSKEAQRSISVEADHLVSRRSNGRQVHLLPLAEHVFYDRDYPFIHFVFAVDATGKVDFLLVRTRFGTDVAQRIDEPLPAE